MTEAEIREQIAEIEADMKQLAAETRRANESWHQCRRELIQLMELLDEDTEA